MIDDQVVNLNLHLNLNLDLKLHFQTHSQINPSTGNILTENALPIGQTKIN
jgi:hypothetical protein